MLAKCLFPAAFQALPHSIILGLRELPLHPFEFLSELGAVTIEVSTGMLCIRFLPLKLILESLQLQLRLSKSTVSVQRLCLEAVNLRVVLLSLLFKVLQLFFESRIPADLECLRPLCALSDLSLKGLA